MSRWFYFLQEMHRKNKICFSALLKAGVTSKNGLVPASEVNKKWEEQTGIQIFQNVLRHGFHQKVKGPGQQSK